MLYLSGSFLAPFFTSTHLIDFNTRETDLVCRLIESKCENDLKN